MKQLLLLVLLLLSMGCNSQKAEVINEKKNTTDLIGSRIAQYVTSVYEDSKGHLWFGTLNKGIGRYDGHQLKYFTMNDGLPSNRAIGIIEDAAGAYWISTGAGISKYKEGEFTNYKIKDDLLANSVSTLFLDSKGTLWVGTWGGVYTFSNEKFNSFPIPYPEVNTRINQDTKDWITDITEDINGNIWICRDGFGITKYDGTSFTYILKKDGIHSNNVTELIIDSNNSMWVGTRVAEKDNPIIELRKGAGGINKIVNGEVLSFPDIEAFNNDDVYSIYRDDSQNIWISTVANGVYRYNGESFKKYDVPISIMGMTKDKKGTLWLGGAGGLYKITKAGEVINVTTKGPWK